MSEALLQAFAVFSACIVLASWSTALLYRMLRGRLAALAPEPRNTLQAFSALIPIGLAVAATLWVLHPPLAFTLLPEHCHGNLCDPHQPLLAMGSFGGVTLTSAGLLVFSLCLALLLSGLLRGRRQQKLLDRLSRAESGYRVIESPALQAWCFGLWWPRAYLSSAAVDTFSARELRAVLAHEYCHALRRDNLRRLIIAALTLVWPPESRKQFLRDFSLSTEQLCDQSAAVAVGDAALVSATLRRVEPNDGPQTQERLQSLGTNGGEGAPVNLWLVLAAAWGAQFVLMLLSAHLLLEWLLPV